MFSVLGDYKIKFTYSIATNPYFTRKYLYEAGNSGWNYWNLR